MLKPLIAPVTAVFVPVVVVMVALALAAAALTGGTCAGSWAVAATAALALVAEVTPRWAVRSLVLHTIGSRRIATAPAAICAAVMVACVRVWRGGMRRVCVLGRRRGEANARVGVVVESHGGGRVVVVGPPVSDEVAIRARGLSGVVRGRTT